MIRILGLVCAGAMFAASTAVAGGCWGEAHSQDAFEQTAQSTQPSEPQISTPVEPIVVAGLECDGLTGDAKSDCLVQITPLDE